MQPIRRLWTIATLRAIRRGGPFRPGGNTRQWALKLCTAGCLVLVLLFAGARPAAAAGACTDGDVNHTIIHLHTEGGYDLQFNLHLQGDKIIGGLFANPAHPGEHSIRASVAGHLYPDGGIFIEVFLWAPPGEKFLISGTLTEGGGLGTLKYTAAVEQLHTWVAKTSQGCPKWPQDVIRNDLANAAEAQADQAAPALAAANPLYACDKDSWSPSSVGGLGQEFVSDCAKKAVNALPWHDANYGASVTQRALQRVMATGPGSMAWNACEAALSKRVDGIIEQMKPTCEKAKRANDAKNRCVPVHSTADGRIYQNVPSPFTSEGKDVQLCMNEVQHCFDRNADTKAQDSCAANVLGCFDFDTGSGARAGAARLFGGGGGGAAAIAAIAARTSASRANIFCLSQKSASDTLSAFVPRGKNWSILVGGSANGRAVGNTYVDAASSGLWCQPRPTAASAILIRHASVSLAFADRLDLSNTRLVSLNSGDWCPPAATIPVVSVPSDGKVAPKLMKSSSGSDGSFRPAESVVKRTPQGGAPAVRKNLSSSGAYPVKRDCGTAMDRLTGDCGGFGGGGVSPSSSLPNTSLGPRGSSGAIARPSSQSSSGMDGVQSSGKSVPRQPQSGSGVSMPVGGPGVSGQFGSAPQQPRNSSGAIAKPVPQSSSGAVAKPVIGTGLKDSGGVIRLGPSKPVQIIKQEQQKAREEWLR